MITAERKPLDEILALVGDAKEVLVAGCETCVAVCLSGGEKEAEILASELRIKAKEDGRELRCEHTAAIRQCEWENLDAIAAKVDEFPVVRCSKSLMNGPCGGSHDGKCEVQTPEKEDIDCAWALIWERLKAQGREELMYVNRPPKNWSRSSSGGPRKMVREEAKPV